MKYSENVIKAAMKLRQITVLDIAKVSGMEKSHIHRYITGKRKSEKLDNIFKAVLGRELKALDEINVRILNQHIANGGL